MRHLILFFTIIIGSLAFAQGTPETTPYLSYINPNVNTVYADWRIYNLEDETYEKVYGDTFLYPDFYNVTFVLNDSIKPSALANYDVLRDRIVIQTEKNEKLILEQADLYKAVIFADGRELIHLNRGSINGYYERLAQCTPTLYFLKSYKKDIKPEQQASRYQIYEASSISELKSIEYVYNRKDNSLLKLKGSISSKAKAVNGAFPSKSKKEIKNWLKVNPSVDYKELCTFLSE